MFFRRSKPNLNDNAPAPVEAAVPTVIASDAVLRGDLATDGEIRVAGTVRGTIRARLCIVESGGAVEGDIRADEIIVRGRVIGPLRAYHVHLQPGSHVEGEVINETIVIDSGASLMGSVWHSEDPFATSQKKVEIERLPATEPSSYLQSPLWTASGTSYRPLAAVRPR